MTRKHTTKTPPMRTKVHIPRNRIHNSNIHAHFANSVITTSYFIYFEGKNKAEMSQKSVHLRKFNFLLGNKLFFCRHRHFVFYFSLHIRDSPPATYMSFLLCVLCYTFKCSNKWHIPLIASLLNFSYLERTKASLTLRIIL